MVPLVPEPPVDLVHPGRDSVWARGLRLSPSKTPLEAATPTSCTHRAQGDVPQLQLARASGTRAAPHGHGKILPAAPDSRQGRGSRAVLQSLDVPAAPVPPRAPSSRVAPLCRVVPGDRRTDRAEASTPQDPASPLRGAGSDPVPGWWRLLEGSGFGDPWGLPATAHLGTLLALTALAPHRSHGSLDEGTETPGAARWPWPAPLAIPLHPALSLPISPLPFPYLPSVQGDPGDPAPLKRLADPETNPVGVWGEGGVHSQDWGKRGG